MMGRKKRVREERPPKEVNEIMEELFKSGKVREIIENIGKNNNYDNTYEDLEQDIYLSLMQKPEHIITSLYECDELRFYIARMVANNLNSVTSPYYYTYRRYSKKTDNTIWDDSGETPEDIDGFYDNEWE